MFPSLVYLGLFCLGLLGGLHQPMVFGNVMVPGCRCVPLNECPELRPPVGLRLSYDQAATIRRLKCGQDNRTIKVCCGAGAQPVRLADPPPPPPPVGGGDGAGGGHPTVLPQSCGVTASNDRIHGGKDAPLGGNPWMVALGYLDDNQQLKFQCGASLVTRQHVVTAAHCLHPDAIGFQTLKQLNIGEWNTQTDPDCSVSPASGKRVCAPPVVVRQPAAVTWHPQYNNNGKYNNDIAVIRLDKPVTFGAFIQPICIPADFDPKSRTASDVNPLASATGWGKTEKLDSSPVLQEIKLPLVDMQRCNASYAGILNDKQICAGGVKGEDSCEGDSGGPLVTTSKDGDKHLLIGLTSFGGILCGGHNSYAVYTAVHKYRDWIIQTLAV